MIKTRHVSAAQIFSALFVSRLLVSLTYIPTILKGTDLLWAILLLFPLLILCGLPFWLLFRKSPEQGLMETARSLSPAFAKGLGGLAALWFSLNAAVNLARFQFFVTAQMSPKIPAVLFLLLLALAAVYAARLGIEAMGRGSVVILALMLLGFGAIFVVQAGRVDGLNFVPLRSSPFGTILTTALALMANTVEIALLAVLLPKVRGKLPGRYAGWSFGFTALVFLLFFFAVGVMGDFASTQTFPLYTLTVTAQMGEVQRLDALYTGLWMVGLLVKTGLLFYAGAYCLGSAFPKTKAKQWVLLLGGIAFLGAWLLSGSFQKYLNASGIWNYLIPFLFFVLAVPLGMLIWRWGKERSQ